MPQNTEATLSELRDIVVPAFDPAPIWPTLFVIVCIALAIGATLLFLRQRRYPWRQQVLNQLAAIKRLTLEHRDLPFQTVLRRTALALDADLPRQIAGPEWQNRLNDMLRTRIFTAELGQRLIANPYTANSTSPQDSDLDAVIRSIKNRTRWPW